MLSGIGRCLAITLADLGAEVYGISRTQKHLDSLVAERPSIKTFSQDITKWNETKALVESLPTMDGLVNNAGTNILEPALEVSEESFDS